MSKTAIIIGSSGLVGGLLLDKILQCENYSSVKIFVRKSLNKTHPKLIEVITNFKKLEALRDEINAEVIFSCLGSTRKKTPNKEDYYYVDYEIPKFFASAGKLNGSKQFHVISALGANSKSKNFYMKMKGETEDAILQQSIDTVCIYRPSLITGNRNEKRFAEDAGKVLMKIINPLLFGNLKKYRSLDASIIAQAMLNLSLKQVKGNHIIEGDRIQESGKS